MRGTLLLLAFVASSFAPAQTGASPQQNSNPPAAAATATPTPPAPRPGDVRQDAASLAAQAPPARPEDVKSAEALLAACYDVISGPAGERNWDRFRSLFVPGARLSAAETRPGGKHIVALFSVEDYIRLDGPYFKQNGFFENSLHHDARRFGNVEQIFSSYASHKTPGDTPFERGINSFQMLYDGQRWWIVSILWDAERADNPIPADMAK